MNLNEVKKHVYFNIVIYISIFICFIISLIVILITPVKAQEQTTDITSSIRSNFDCPYGYNASGYCAIQTNNGGGVRAFNTRYNGVLNTIGFAFPYYFNQYSNNEIIDIYSTSNDFRNNNINVSCYSYESSPSQSNIRNCSLRFISQKHIQVVFPYDSLQWHEVILTSQNPITGVSNYLIQKVTLTYDDGQQDLSGIIDNATSNTTDIINNNNSNSEQTQNVIIETAGSIVTQLANTCPNLLNASTFSPCTVNGSSSVEGLWCPGNTSIISSDVSTGSITFSMSDDYSGVMSPYIPIDYSLNYYFSYASNYSNSMVNLKVYDSNYNVVGGREVTGSKSFKVCPSGNQSACFPISARYLRISISPINNGSNLVFNNISLTTQPNLPFCAFGSTISKLDLVENFLGLLRGDTQAVENAVNQVKDIQQDSYNYLTDDTDPTVNQSGINNVLGSVNVQDPLNYLLTLPLNLLTKLNTVISSGTCSRASFGELYGTELYLPCINFENYLGSSLWVTIDTIVGIGLLAIILKKFYDTISNILSLGKEEEIRKGMELPTPMEFFAQILGGGR